MLEISYRILFWVPSVRRLQREQNVSSHLKVTRRPEGESVIPVEVVVVVHVRLLARFRRAHATGRERREQKR